MIETRYDFKQIEPKIYKKWLPHLKIKKQKSKQNAESDKSLSAPKGLPFGIVFLMAPPNITGSLHLGHSLENTLIDILVRYYRMKGQTPVWLPGIDHAGIATQNVVEKELRKQGISRFDLGREKFIEKCWEWKEKYGNIILDQFKKLGITPDWSRVKFTMDKKYVESVEKAFIEYYDKGFIYRDLRPINFCPRCKTGLSDLELEWKPEKGKLYFIKYPVKNQGFIVVATTRPETILGDTAVAVNPKDVRYKNFIRKTAILPVVEKEIPIIADIRIEPNFGTGAVKITPAHSIVDYEISKRHSLKLANVIDENGKMINTNEFNGLNYLDCREKILEELNAKNLIEKIEDYVHEIPHCDRCKTAIQVIPSLEWFVKMGELAKIAKNAIQSKQTLIIPNKYKKPYFDWLKNIRDWCISRKLWWGQSLPVWFCQNQTGRENLEIRNSKFEKKLNANFVVSLTKPKKCPLCKNCEMVRTDEVFDTWFSSALWSFATLYTPQEKKWYPAFMVSSARDILHLWIMRMIFSGLFFKDKAPYKVAFIHPTIQTKEGKRMSKSLGTGIDPLDLIEKYGADALRFGLIWQMSDKQDLRFDEMHIITGKKFATKVWNATRFCSMQNLEIKNQTPKIETEFRFSVKMTNKNSKLKTLSVADKKIIKEFNATLKFVEKNILVYAFAQALQTLYSFFWNDLCDNYLESCKGETKNNPKILKDIIENSLKMLNVFMPFFTEELWSSLDKKQLLLFEKWPVAL